MDKREEHELVFSISTGRPVVKREIVLNRDGFVNSKIDRDFKFTVLVLNLLNLQICDKLWRKIC